MVYDKNFLLQLDKYKNKTIYARITALKFDESPIELIEGRVTQGSINVDGTSAIRRSCSLTMVATNFDYREYYWGMNTKFKLEIGVENHINPAYPNVCWFDQGIYLITQFNTSRNATSFNISISGKDKMSQLNGEIGGNFESSVDFGQIEEQNEDGTWKLTKIPIHRIIREMIHHYAGEPFHNIIINDLDEYGLELLDYQYDTPMYLYRSIDSSIFNNVLFDSLKPCIVNGENKVLGELTPNELDILVDTLTGSNEPAVVTIEGNDYYVAKIEYGQTAGYRMTDLVYPGDLIAAAGETVTSILDKLVQMLGEFEYFYDLKGQFVFQKKKSFVNTLWNPIIENEDEEKYVESLAISGSQSYVFSEGELITAFNNNPNLTNMKNDYSIWGVRASSNGTEIPIHMRFAIDQKPIYYKTYDGTRFYTTEEKSEKVLYDEIFKELYGDFQKKPNPNGLPEEWWDIMDWAERYKMLKGFYPPGRIGQYCKEWVTRDIDLNEYFPAPTDEERLAWYEGQWNHNGNIYIFDVWSDGTLGYFGHMNGCSHYYEYFLDRALEGVGTSYIYKPEIPESEGGDVSVIVEQIMKSHNYNQDWREVIYQMALDYYQHGQKEDFEQKIIANNYPYYPSGLTGYESYYVDLQGFWRQLYYPIDKIIDEEETKKTELLENKEYLCKISQEDNIEVFTEEIDNLINLDRCFDKFFTDNQFGPKKEKGETDDHFEKRMQDTVTEFKDTLAVKIQEITRAIEKSEAKITDATTEKPYYYLEDEAHPGWRKDVYESPQSLNFWFDFLDSNGELFQFSASNVGRRPKVINDSNVKSIYFRDTPDIIFRENDTDEIMTGYKYIQIPVIDSMFRISMQGKSAKDKLDELIYNHAYCIENATITSIPIYHLEPNTRVYVHDEETGIDGDYIVSKFTIPLSYNGTMSITATKAAENIV